MPEWDRPPLDGNWDGKPLLHAKSLNDFVALSHIPVKLDFSCPPSNGSDTAMKVRDAIQPQPGGV